MIREAAWSITEASKVLKIGRQELAAIIDAEDIPTIDIGKTRAVTPDAMERLRPFAERLRARRDN
jgi:hypothetical protein